MTKGIQLPTFGKTENDTGARLRACAFNFERGKR